MNILKSNEDRHDRRCLKTKKAIKKSFIKLMVEKRITDITIKEIADDADINRKTFYAHYIDVYSVLNEIENDLIEKLYNILSNHDILKSRYNPYPLFKEFNAEINRDFDFYKHLVQSTSYSRLLIKMKSIFKDKIINVVKNEIDVDKELLSYAVDFMAAGTISVYEMWFNSKRDISLEEISKTVSLLVSDGINAVIDRNV